MNKFYEETYRKLETAIMELEIETDCPLKRVEAIIPLIIQSLSDLKKFVLKKDDILTDLPKLKWTANKVALIELIYALYAQGVFDNGNADIKAIAKTFERTFNINLGDFYHTFMELKARKINQTKFLDSMRDTLIKRMEERGEK